MFWALARRRDVVVRALKTAALVGAVLVAINHGDALLTGSIAAEQLAKMVLTVLVPYCVSTYSSVRAIQASQAVAGSRGG